MVYLYLCVYAQFVIPPKYTKYILVHLLYSHSATSTIKDLGIVWLLQHNYKYF